MASNTTPRKILVNRPNKLRDYSSYTYGLSLHLLTPGSYNKIVGTGQIDYTATNVLVASAGRHDNSNFKRNDFFKEDFYFDELEVTTVIGMSQKTRSSNALDLSFKLIEPYGMTFLNRLLLAIDGSTEKGRNYLDLPYLIQLDFFGYDDSGNAADLTSLTKYIPIKIVGLKMTVTNRGAEYSFKAVQYHDQAFTELMGAIPSAMELKSGTVAGFLTQLENAMKNKQATLVTDKRREIQDQYVFELGDSSIGTSSIILSGANPKRKPMADPRSATRSDSSGSTVGNRQPAAPPPPTTTRTENADTVQADPKTIITQFNAGTSLLVVLENLMKSSSYFREQIDLSESATANNNPIYWVRIIPKIELLGFDKKINRYAKKITYQIVKYEVYNNKYPWGPAAKADDTKHSVKKYEYIYTGKNTEILDFNLEFDAMFYVFTTVDKARTLALSGKGDGEEASTKDPNVTVSGKTNGVPKQGGGASANQQTTSSDGNKDPNAVAASDLLNSMVSGSKGDMVQVKLKIHGDPDFIKQDNVFFMNGTAGSSIPTDSGEVYVTLTFKSPTDIDEDTGMYKFTNSNNPMENFIFSGLYKVLTVKNSFRGGKFEQELQLVRLFDQEKYDFVSG